MEDSGMEDSGTEDFGMDSWVEKVEKQIPSASSGQALRCAQADNRRAPKTDADPR